MIKTLRITTVIIVVLAGVLFVFPVVFGARGDERIEGLLNGPTITEVFNNAAAGRTKTSESQISPLVEQARAFALFLNPPAKPRETAVGQVPPPPKKPDVPRPEAPVSAKFDLLATSVNQSNPKQSLAFINEPGKGTQWVWQGAEVGHLVIEQVKDGVVVVRDKETRTEVRMQNKPDVMSLIEGSPSSAASQSTAVSASATEAVSARPTADAMRARAQSAPPAAAGTVQPQLGPQDDVKLEELVDKLKALQEGKGPDGQSPGQDKDTEMLMEVMKKLMSGEQSGIVSVDEANNLEALGQDLQNAEKGAQKPPQSGAPSSKADPQAPRSYRPTRKPPQLPPRYQDPRRGR